MSFITWWCYSTDRTTIWTRPLSHYQLTHDIIGPVSYRILTQWKNHLGSSGEQRRRARGPWPPNRDRGQITGCLIHITQYRGYQDACARHTFPVLHFRKEMCHSNRIHAVRNAPLLSLAAAQEVTRQRKCLHSQHAWRLYLGFKITVARLLD